MIVKYIKDSILNTHCRYVGHGVNCQNTMRSGVAKVLFEKYPEVKKYYHEHINKEMKKYNYTDLNLLGTVQPVAHPRNDKIILNCFTQRYYGYDKNKYVNYDSIHECFDVICKLGIKEIAIPKIGCGLARGNWEIVSRIIDDATGDNLDVYVYYLEDK